MTPVDESPGAAGRSDRPDWLEPLKAKWEKITDADILEIAGNLVTFTAVLTKRYGATQNGEVNTWANRRYSHWSGNYTSKYADPVKVA